jgi:hypothetical protein
METQSLFQTTRLVRRSCICHCRRRVPDGLVATVGKREIHRSLATTNLAEAKQMAPEDPPEDELQRADARHNALSKEARLLVRSLALGFNLRFGTLPMA